MLTNDQKVVADAVLKKLFEGKEQEIIISGPAGTGKTFLLNYILNDIVDKYKKTVTICGLSPKFLAPESPYVTATTNKAVGVLRQSFMHYVSTIESALGLVVQGDYTKGEYRLVPAKTGLNTITDCIVIIDEASMIDWSLYTYIKTCCIGCFIIYTGDDCQLPAVKSGNKPLIWQMGLPEYKLTTQVRQMHSPELGKLCNQLRHTVQTGQFKPVKCTVGVVQVCEPEEQKKILLSDNYDKIVTYTNAKSIKYNDWIMEQKHGGASPGSIYPGEDYIVNDFYKESRSGLRLSAETLIRITKIKEYFEGSYNGATCKFIRVDAATPSVMASLIIPEDREYYMRWLKFIAKHKDWQQYFMWKERVIDIRGSYACTIHKAQGSTFDNVIIDADDFKTCTNPKLAARLLYVAVSRARYQVTFFGELPKKYGEIVCQNLKPTTLST